MQYPKTLILLVLSAFILLTACKDKTKELPTKKATPKPVSFEPPQNADGVWHYVCSKRCAGGSGAIGQCAKCGANLVHNTLYHGSSQPQTPTSGAPFATPPATAPGRNAAGVWHYTCANGCSGGSGTRGDCTVCGSTLAHNQAYHE